MRTQKIIEYLSTLLSLTTTATSFRVIPERDLPEQILSGAMSSQNGPPQVLMGDSAVVMSDMMAVHRDISLFAEFVRSSEAVTHRLDNSRLNTTVLAPLNSVVKELPRKPWEDPETSDSYAGQAGEDRAARNLERFVEAHIIPESPLEEKQKVKTLGGKEIWWEQDGDNKIIQPDGVKVRQIRSTVVNGQIWILEGIINYAQR